MSEMPLASVVINNYNYGRYLRQAIDSALAQTYGRVEVIVVDDGSTDESREVIEGYGNSITPVLQENAGQAAALNAGFRASRGKVVCFLDADDVLLPTAMERAVPLFRAPHVAKVHWPLRAIDARGAETGQVVPGLTLPEGDLRDVVLREGPLSSGTPPTSGNAWSRGFLGRALPVPAEEYRICADAYLCSLAPVCGAVRTVREPQGFYRIHGRNNYWGKPFEERLRLGLLAHEQQCLALAKFLEDAGVAADVEDWKRNSWDHRLHRAVEEIAAVIPDRDPFILVDEDHWGTDEVLAGHRRIPFPERGGQYWGKPADDATAVRELRRQVEAGVRFLVIGWPAFWWLDYYAALGLYLRAHSRCALENDRLAIFHLRP